jgi:hypothetical protein
LAEIAIEPKEQKIYRCARGDPSGGYYQGKAGEHARQRNILADRCFH